MNGLSYRNDNDRINLGMFIPNLGTKLLFALLFGVQNSERRP